MKLAMIGLGKMGANMSRRLLTGGHQVLGYDPGSEAAAKAERAGIAIAPSLEAAAQALEPPRVLWLMVPAGPAVDETISALQSHLGPSDIVVDGGNSHYRDTQRRGRELGARGVRFVDAGTSGGVWGLEQGYCLMVGGDREAIDTLRPVLETLAPAPDRGWGHVGPSGAGHFVKMIHNGIEYALMQAYAEGFSILSRKQEPELDLHQVAEIWRYGSVIRSWLLDLTSQVLEENPGQRGIAPWVADSGEGRWTVAEAIDLNVPAPALTLALIERLASRDENSYTHRLLASMRRAFGGHAVRSGE